jgi:predicted enzyme related to lactoylglutathione lyase
MDHTVVHFEIPADDPERAVRFYSELFGWEFQRWGGIQEAGASAEAGTTGPERDVSAQKSGGAGGAGPEYWLISTVPTDEQGRPTRAGVNGGLMRRQHPGHGPLNYISVESADEYATNAERLGADVVVPKMPVPGMGWFIWLKDPEGNVFGIWQDDPSAK